MLTVVTMGISTAVLIVILLIVMVAMVAVRMAQRRNRSSQHSRLINQRTPMMESDSHLLEDE